MKLLETMYTKITKVINKVLSRFIIPDKQYQNIKDLNVDEIMELKSKYGIGGVILDIDGTIRVTYYYDKNTGTGNIEVLPPQTGFNGSNITTINVETITLYKKED